ncbi:MAG: cell division protein ZapA [Salinisphaeraceae bacterium]|nr:cell division protein ZapA [Salinisphaeraceae bacterium]
MSDQTRSTELTVRILDRDYQVLCPENERESLLESAEYLSARMAGLKKKGQSLGSERLAVMTALNMARELLEQQNRSKRRKVDDEAGDRLKQLQLQIESVLEANR